MNLVVTELYSSFFLWLSWIQRSLPRWSGFMLRRLWRLHWYVLSAWPLCFWSAIQNNQRRDVPESSSDFALNPVHAGIGPENPGEHYMETCAMKTESIILSYAPACSALGPRFERLPVTLWPYVPHFQGTQESVNIGWEFLFIAV